MLPHASFTNLYGPTEATIASSHYTVPRPPVHEREPIPIGSACAGEELMILDSEMRAVADSEIGDLYIGGVGLSPGYWNDPDKTREVFLPRPGGAGPHDRIYRNRRPGAPRRPTVCSISPVAAIPRSRAAVTASSSAKSRQLCMRCPDCANAPWSPYSPRASKAG